MGGDDTREQIEYRSPGNRYGHLLTGDEAGRSAECRVGPTGNGNERDNGT